MQFFQLMKHFSTAFTEYSCMYTVSQKNCQCYFLNNSVKHWPTFIIFGIRHHKETRCK